MIVREFCKECGKCCIGELTGNKMCEHLTSTGCQGTWDIRDDGCKAYPFVIIKDTRFVNSRRIFIDTACPHWKKFGDLLDDLKKERLEPTIFILSKSESENAI